MFLFVSVVLVFKLTTQRTQSWSDDPRGGWVIGASNSRVWAVGDYQV